MVKGIQRNEIILTTIKDKDDNIYYMTIKGADRSCYYLYKMVNGQAEKQGKAKNPLDLEEKYILF